MMLDNYISDLLYRYQCVTVPGFGAFVAETVPAQVNGSAATFLPPRKIITFNSNIKNNDGLLANHIAANENVSFEKATEMIAQKVASWNFELDQRNALVFDKIGTINVNGEEKNLVFEPANTTNFLVSSFGLSQFVSPEVKREVLKQEVEALDEKAPMILSIKQRLRLYRSYQNIPLSIIGQDYALARLRVFLLLVRFLAWRIYPLMRGSLETGLC